MLLSQPLITFATCQARFLGTRLDGSGDRAYQTEFRDYSNASGLTMKDLAGVPESAVCVSLPVWFGADYSRGVSMKGKATEWEFKPSS